MWILILIKNSQTNCNTDRLLGCYKTSRTNNTVQSEKFMIQNKVAWNKFFIHRHTCWSPLDDN